MTGMLRFFFSLTLAALVAGGCKSDGAPKSADGAGSNAVEPSVSAPKKFVPTRSLRLVATQRTGLEKLKAIALDDRGRRYLAHAGGVAVFDAAWKPVADLATPKPAVGVAVHKDGRVFVALRRQWMVFGASGKPVTRWGTPGDQPGQLRFLTGIAVGESDVWLADMGNRVIHRFDTTGDFVSDVAGRDPERGVAGIICPSDHLDCVVAPDGTLYNSNPGRWRVEHYDLNGRLLGYWGRQGSRAERFQGCCNPTNLALRPGGGFVTSEKGRTPRVKIHDAAGRVQAVAGAEYFSRQAAGMDLAVDGDGQIFVIDPGAGAVLVFRVEKP